MTETEAKKTGQAPEGFFKGAIMDAWTEYESEEDKKDVRLHWIVQLDDGYDEVECRHRTTSDRIEKTTAIVESLEQTYPAILTEMEKTIGRRVRVNVVHKQGTKGGTFINGYIVLGSGGRGRRMSKEEQALALAKASGTGLPF